MWSKYHITVEETADLLEGSDEWSIAQDPGGVQGAETSIQNNADGTSQSSEARVDPYYTLLRLPEENEQQFVIFRSFVPFSKNDAVKELQGFMAGVSEPTSDSYGRLVSYEVTSDSDMCHGLSDSINALFGVHIPGAQRAGTDDTECIGDIQTSRARAESAASSSAGTPITLGDGTAVEQAADLLRQANDALGNGDLGRYQELVDTAGRLLEEALVAEASE